MPLLPPTAIPKKTNPWDLEIRNFSKKNSAPSRYIFNFNLVSIARYF